MLATLLRLEEPGNTVANHASSSGDCTPSTLHRGQCLRLVGHTVTVEIDAAEWAGDYISGTRDASAYRDGTSANTRTGSFRGVLERRQRPIRVVIRLLGLRGNVQIGGNVGGASGNAARAASTTARPKTNRVIPPASAPAP
jgi:hypothetical protein